MNALKITIMLVFCVSFAYSKCYYVSCDAQIDNAQNDSKNKIASSFDEVQNKLQILEQSYKESLDELKSSNELLRKQIALSKNSLLEVKKLIFLLKQFNQLKVNTINQDSIKEKQ